MFLIDTSVLSEPRRPRPDGNVLLWLGRQEPATLFLSAVTVMEIARGAQKQRAKNPAHADALEIWLEDNLVLFGDRVLPLTSGIARRWGRLQIDLKRDDDDLALAATALEHNLTVVTRNVRHFD